MLEYLAMHIEMLASQVQALTHQIYLDGYTIKVDSYVSIYPPERNWSDLYITGLHYNKLP